MIYSSLHQVLVSISMQLKTSGKTGGCMTMLWRNCQSFSLKTFHSWTHLGHLYVDIQWVGMVHWQFTWKIWTNTRFITLFFHIFISMVFLLMTWCFTFALIQSVSAFAPIANPMNCPWGHKAFSGYLGDNKTDWEVWSFNASILYLEVYFFKCFLVLKF